MGVYWAGGILRSTVSIAEHFKDLSKSVNVALHVSKGPNIIFGLVAVKLAVSDVRKILDRSTKGGERAKASALFVTHLTSIVNTVATVSKILASVGAVPTKAIQWIPIFNMVSFAVGFISVGLSIISTEKARKLMSSFHSALKEYEAAKTPEEKAKALSEALTFIEKEGIEPLRKQLVLSKKGGAELASRVDILKTHIYAKSVTPEDLKLIRLLKGRAKVQLAYKITDLAGLLSAQAAIAMTLIPVPVAAQIAGAAVLATAGSVALVAWGGRYFCINKNPFDESSKNRAMAMLDAASQAISTLKHSIQTFSKGKKRIVAHSAA